MEPWLSLLWVLVCVVLIVGLAYWCTRAIGLSGGMGIPGLKGGTEQLKVLARLPLGRDQLVVLIQVGERFLLLGVTASNVNSLAELTREEASAWLSAPETPASPSFGEALRAKIWQKKQR